MKKVAPILLLLSLSFGFTQVWAQSDLEAELMAKKAAKEALEAELAQDQAKLNEVSAQKNTLNKAVTELELTGKKLTTEVKLTETKISETESKIKNLDETIEQKEKKIKNFHGTISQGLREIHKNDARPFILTILETGSLADAVNETENRISLNKSIKDSIDELRIEQEALAGEKSVRLDKKAELLDYRGEVITQKTQVEVNKKEKTSLLNQTKQEEANYQKIINEKRRLQAQYEEDLAAIEAKIQLNIDPNSYPKAKNGLLVWPTEKVFITQGFGLTGSSASLYSYRTGVFQGRHAGVDFRANYDKVLAMADGVVMGAGDTDGVCPRASTGIWIAIKHDNGLASFYYHLSSTVAKPGSRVKAGDLVAYSGNTGYSTAPHLHVGLAPAQAVSIKTWASAGCPGKNYTTPVVANSLYLNALDYLPKASSDMFKGGVYVGE